MRLAEIIRSIDYVAVGAAALLVAVGLAMLVSATYTEAILSALFLRQAASAALALLAFAVVVYIHYRTTARYTWVVYGVGVASLLAVTAFGTLVRGATSRLVVLGTQVQPSEFMKVGLLLALAWLASRLSRSRAFAVSLLTTALPVGLVLLEPDLGVAALLIAVWVGLVMFQGMSWKVFSVLLLLGALLLGASWQWLLADYQKARLSTFLNPASDPRGAGYNVLQSIVALGSGGVLGRGLGHGPQSQLKFLPERHTDFILASIGEELGFVGVVLVIALYTVLLWRILVTARRTRDPFAQSFCVGVFTLLLVSLTVSAGMNMGLLPVTGIPLPLVSFGGSNLFVTGILLGIVQSIRVYGRWMRPAPIEITHF